MALVQWIQEKERDVIFITANMLSSYAVRCYLKLVESVLWQTQDGFHDMQWKEFIEFANIILHDALEKNFSASTAGSASAKSGSKLSGKSWIEKAVLGSVRPDKNLGKKNGVTGVIANLQKGNIKNHFNI